MKVRHEIACADRTVTVEEERGGAAVLTVTRESGEAQRIRLTPDARAALKAVL